jgi:hypothetical protein
MIIMLEPPDRLYSLDSMFERMLPSKTLSWFLTDPIPFSELIILLVPFQAR